MKFCAELHIRGAEARASLVPVVTLRTREGWLAREDGQDAPLLPADRPTDPHRDPAAP